MNEASRPTDETLVEAARHDKEVFGVIVERYEAPLSRYVRRLGVQTDDDVLDILQDTFIKVYRNLNEFDTSLKFSSWIYRITHNETMSFFRKRRVRPEGHLAENSEDVLEFISDSTHSGEDVFNHSQNATAITHALNSLDQKYREVIILRFFEQKEYDEISDILEIPIGTVGTLIHRAKRALKERIDINSITI